MKRLHGFCKIHNSWWQLQIGQKLLGYKFIMISLLTNSRRITLNRWTKLKICRQTISILFKHIYIYIYIYIYIGRRAIQVQYEDSMMFTSNMSAWISHPVWNYCSNQQLFIDVIIFCFLAHYVLYTFYFIMKPHFYIYIYIFWCLKNKGLTPEIECSILKKSNIPNSFDGWCNLCLKEKIHIMTYKLPEKLLNNRSEIISRCRH